MAAGAFFVVNGAFYIFITFVVSYGTTVLHVASSTMLTGTLVGAVGMAITILAAGILSDRVGRLPVYLAGAAFIALIAFPVFWLIDTKSPFVATALLIQFHNASWPIAIYVIAMAAITFVCTYLAGETHPALAAQVAGGGD